MSEWIKKLAEGYKTVNENQKAALQKKLAKASASSEKIQARIREFVRACIENFQI